MKALVYITPKEGILDPEGLIVSKALRSLGLDLVDGVRVGKLVELDLGTASKNEAEAATREACERLLVNPNIEAYSFELTEAP